MASEDALEGLQEGLQEGLPGDSHTEQSDTESSVGKRGAAAGPQHLLSTDYCGPSLFCRLSRSLPATKTHLLSESEPLARCRSRALW